jgi:hypothetical protein
MRRLADGKVQLTRQLYRSEDRPTESLPHPTRY